MQLRVRPERCVADVAHLGLPRDVTAGAPYGAVVDVRELVKDHYSPGHLTDAILATLSEAGIDVDALTAGDLFAVDQLHAGGARATRHLLDQLAPDTRSHLLDVGCGIGGPSRMAATDGSRVTGIDLSQEFVDTATDLTARAGLGDMATFLATAGESLPFDDGTFDGAFMVHVGMNIPDKRAVLAEVRRVLEPGARFVLFEQMRTGDGELPYPLPWAVDERSSFVEGVAAYTTALESAHFTIEAVEDRTASTLGPPPTGALSPAMVFGEAFVQRVDNNVAATRAGTLGAILMVARA